MIFLGKFDLASKISIEYQNKSPLCCNYSIIINLPPVNNACILKKQRNVILKVLFMEETKEKKCDS